MFFSAPPPSAPRSSTARPPPRNWRLCGALPELGLQMRSKGVLADDSGWSCNIYEYRGDRWRRARPSQEWYFRFENIRPPPLTGLEVYGYGRKRWEAFGEYALTLVRTLLK
ncbi:hypothetical protein EDB86DRAFT_2829046 [Lactarius hatsudake]|nr:hypothetical protein EDB86DRAFT_2829046 [Lactarius hatsudake]